MIFAAWKNAIIVLIFAAIVLLPALGKITLTEHEVFAAEPAREMLGGGTLAYQQFAGQPRLKKPPGQSWLIAASIAAARSASDFAARLPSAISGAGLAATAALIGTWTMGRRIGLIAGLMMLTCVGLQQRAHLAEADMALAFAVAIANAAVIRPLTRERLAGRAWGLLFWLAVVAGFLLKGPIVLGFTVLPAAVAWATIRFRPKDADFALSDVRFESQRVHTINASVADEEKPPREINLYAAAIARGPLWWPWIVLGLFLIAAWVIAALHALPFPAAEAMAKWKHEIGDRVSGDIRRDPLIAYVWLIPQATLPWIVFAFAAIGPYRRLKIWRRPAETFLNWWAICGALMISAIAFKRMHYALPMLLPVILQSAYGFDRLLGWWLDRQSLARQPAAYWGAMTAWFGAAIIGWLLNWTIFAPRADSGLAVKTFAAKANSVVPAGQVIDLYKVGEDRVAWYLRRPIRGSDVLPAGQGYVICKMQDSDDLMCERSGKALEKAETYTPDGKQTEEQRDAELRLLIHLPGG